MCGSSAPGFLLGSLSRNSGPQHVQLGTGGERSPLGRLFYLMSGARGLMDTGKLSEPQSSSLKWGCGVCHLVLQRNQ